MNDYFILFLGLRNASVANLESFTFWNFNFSSSSHRHRSLHSQSVGYALATGKQKQFLTLIEKNFFEHNEILYLLFIVFFILKPFIFWFSFLLRSKHVY